MEAYLERAQVRTKSRIGEKQFGQKKRAVAVGNDVQEIGPRADMKLVSPETDPTFPPEPEAEDDLPLQIEAAVAASFVRTRQLPWTAAMARNGGRGEQDVEFLDPTGILQSVHDAGGFFALIKEPLVWPSFERKEFGWAGDAIRREFSAQASCVEQDPDDPRITR